MPVDLSKPASQVDIDSNAYKDLLAGLQANILKSHGRNASRQVFLRFTGSAGDVRKWIREKVAPRVLTAAVQMEHAEKRRADKSFDGGIVILFSLSAAGYAYLGFDPKKFGSEAFRKGMKDQDDGLIEGVLGTRNKDPKPAAWEPGFQKTIHAMVTLADDEASATRLLNELSLLKAEVAGLAEVVAVDEGRTLRRPRPSTPDPDDFEPIEHFGYFDGISQPLFTQQDLKDYYDKKVGTGPGIGWDPGASLDLLLVADPFATAADAYGSYLVYRKLHQDYGLFHGRVATCAGAIGASADLAGAMVVGRFTDGTPVMDSDKPMKDYTNDFVFETQDEKGYRCPRHAHIRKVNPRGTTPLTSMEREKRRRIARRGIPYGKPMPGLCEASTPTDPNPSADRGLLFMCYQANIEKQFEFIQRTWVDNPNFPTQLVGGRDTGDDPLIGQDRNEKQRWPKKWGDEASGKTEFNFEAAVTLKGGEYLFTPSKPFLAAL